MAAREAFAARGYHVDFRDARSSPGQLEEMLRLSNGSRRVPVIVEDGVVTIGFEGGT